MSEERRFWFSITALAVVFVALFMLYAADCARHGGQAVLGAGNVPVCIGGVR